ncbi:cell division cycle and apoptosis regulator protein 1-like [Haematobia irritans]|uniref:cell division cycle and apoptosis regulator protein 1-like n=1 Tax=Haematobia irritans TaxID=7368 RepID=UPI003F50B962
MSFGGGQPWQRNNMMGQQMQFMQTPQQNNMAAFQDGGMYPNSGGGGGGGMYPNSGGGGGGSSVSYPMRPGLNPVAFQGGNMGGVGGGNGGGGGLAQYNSIGTVTKINNDCGLVNNEVFFYRNVCKGPEPKLGDRVIFESTYSSTGQFKWNATRIQMMQSKPQAPMMNTGRGSFGSPIPTGMDYSRNDMLRYPSPKRGLSPPLRGDRHDRDRRDRDRERDRLHRSRDREDDELEWKRRREDHDRSRDRNNSAGRTGAASLRSDRDRERESRKDRDLLDRDRNDRDSHRDREREQREREREREKGKDKEKEKEREKPREPVVPKNRRARAIRRYMVQIPKTLLCLKSADVQELKNRYTSLYIPSDFFHANMKWTETFTPDNPFSLRRPCQFHIMDKGLESPFEQKLDDLEPDDADYVYSAKVMLMSLPPIADFYKNCFDNNDDLDRQPTHPSRLVKFLVGTKGRNEPMAIGGPWSPSLDGENPDTDPSVLIRTAIRTCRALTGIDLSNCTQWYRFVELYYHRTEYKNMEKDGPPRVETVVFFIPDVHSCMPTQTEYETLSALYTATSENIIARRAAQAKALASAATADDNNDSTNNETDNKAEADGDGEQNDNDDAEDAKQEENDENNEEDENNAANEDPENAEESEQMDMDNSAEAEADEDMDENEDNAAADALDENEDGTPEPTHYSMLDLKTMKVREIRDELVARDLSHRGVRNVVVARLNKALNTEKAEELKALKRERMQKIQQNNSGKKEASAKPKKGGKSSDKKDANKDDWADAIDFELSDIVILDEYDASKHPEDKEFTEREKSQLKRRYTLPPTPQIVVQPNKLAKDGHFDCAIMSLSVLLDYHPEDTKERFFELYLFAELFNEMLMRDFAFNIYKEIYIYNEKDHPAENNAENDAKQDSEKTTTETNGENEEKSSNKTEDESSNKSRKRRLSTADGRENSGENGSEKKPPPKRRMSTVDGREATSDDKKQDAGSNNADKKMVVVKPHLLLSFLYFDTTRCGYIFERDLEDLFAVLGLNLSRSQIKKVLGKLASKQSIHYRKLTDKEQTDESIPSIEDKDDIPVEELKDIAVGNNKYEFVFGENHFSYGVTPLDEDENNQSDLINYNGTVIHVGKLMEQIKRTEKNYSDMETLYNELLKQHSDLQKEHTKFSTKIKDLQADTKSLTRKLADTNQDLYSLNRKYRDQNSTMSYIYTRVAPYFSREKDKDKDSKSESSHKDEKKKDEKDEKSKDKDGHSEKDHKDKHKDKSKEKDKDKEGDKAKSKDEKAKDNEKEEVKDTEMVETVKKEKEETNEKEKSTEVVKEKEKPNDSENEKIEKEVEAEKPTEETEKVQEKETPKTKKEEVKKEVAASKPVTEEKPAVTKPKPEPSKPAQTPKATPVKSTAPATGGKAVQTPAKSTPAKSGPTAKATPAKATPAKATPTTKVAPSKPGTAGANKPTPGKANPTLKKTGGTVAKKTTTDNSQK